MWEAALTAKLDAEEQAALMIALEELAAQSEIVIDRPRDSQHPRFPKVIYPLDYGYLKGTSAADGDGIDIFIGSGSVHDLSAYVLVLDHLKKELEIKLLLGTTDAEVDLVCDFLRGLHLTIGAVRRSDPDAARA